MSFFNLSFLNGKLFNVEFTATKEIPADEVQTLKTPHPTLRLLWGADRRAFEAVEGGVDPEV